ncbi:thiamine diphosphokinase [Proteiniclasticum sp.]|uniref:thiamine diphosphokinase n=1 Tax=Proteiniclasticum sp. TaxID=2053595 RepID=UPI0025EB56A7|nr:thiamine diphosphokinase [Proteiniclasticum sp.]
MSKAIIVSGGKKPSRSLFDKLLNENTYLIAVDKGAEFFREENIVPDLLVGDFDSISKETLSFFQDKTIVKSYDEEKDFTDTEAALHEAIILGVDEIDFLGCTGNRLDHFAGNLALLDQSLDKGVKAYMYDDHNKIYLMKSPGVIERDFGRYISFQGFRGPVRGFGVKGVKYPLWNYDLKFGDPRTISNEFIQDKISVTFTEGALLVFMTED